MTTTDPFVDLDAYIALPRLAGIRAAEDGSVVAVVEVLAEDATTYRVTYWLVPADADATPTELVMPLEGARDVRPLAADDFVFLAPVEDGPTSLFRWTPGDAPRDLGGFGGGLDAILAIGDKDVIAAATATEVLGQTAEESIRRRRLRQERRVEAVLHATYPPRDLAVDIGPDESHVVALGLQGDEPARDLTSRPGHAFRHASAVLSPDGTTAFVAGRDGSHLPGRLVVYAIDVHSGDRRVVVDVPGADAEPLDVSPDGRWLLHFRTGDDSSGPRTDRSLWICRLDGSASTCISDPVDEAWYPEARFVDDDHVVLAPARRHAAPIVVIEAITSGDPQVRTVTDGPWCYSQLTVDRARGSCLAVRSSVEHPAQLVRVHLHDGHVDVLVDPTPIPGLPGRVETITTTVPGPAGAVEVSALLVVPAGAGPDRPAPLLTFIHGGPLGAWGAWLWGWNPWPAVARGYAVLLPNPAMSLGFGREHAWRGSGAWGREPYLEMLALCDAAQRRPEVGERTALLGCSWGGYMTNWTAGQTDRFDAIVTHAGIWDFHAFVASTDITAAAASWIDPDDIDRWSPHRYVDRITTPMLIIHGDKDYRIPVTQALAQWSDLLHRIPDGADQPHRLLIFPDEHHVVLKPQNTKVWHETILAFVDTHLLGRPWARPELLG